MQTKDNDLKYRSNLQVGQRNIGGWEKTLICGPCAIESEDQMRGTAELLKRLNIPIMRGGAFKPRSSPKSFRGLGSAGLQIMMDVCHDYGLLAVSEILDPRQCDLFCTLHVDILQIGSRNMQNFPLLIEAGKTRRPILLKRGFMSTIEEILSAAEYIMEQGNDQVIFCERGIRTFEPMTRNTLDLSFVPLVKKLTSAPIIVDLSHALGRTDIMLPMAKAALASGADGIMLEVHPNPKEARSDGKQSLAFEDLEKMIADLEPFKRFVEGKERV